MTETELKKWCLTQAYNIVQVEKCEVDVLKKAMEIYEWVSGKDLPIS
jgi:hypothetical protein